MLRGASSSTNATLSAGKALGNQVAVDNQGRSLGSAAFHNYSAASTLHSSPPISLNCSSSVPRSVKVWATRRRREEKSDTYVLLEPGKDETFVSEEELKVRLKSYLENWPTKTLPPDLARFEDMEDAVSFLVGYACELEIDGDVGSLQWYQVRLD
ncbi:Protein CHLORORESPIRATORY REDUCTION 7, chloroplastic [Linum grandiflorum]